MSQFSNPTMCKVKIYGNFPFVDNRLITFRPDRFFFQNFRVTEYILNTNLIYILNINT